MANIVRFNDPFAGLTSLHSQLDDIFNSFVAPTSGRATQGIPAMDVYTEGDKQLTAEVQAPGFTPEDVEVTVNNGVLEIKGEKHDKEEPSGKDKKNYMVRESHARFYRSIVLPKHADADNISAGFKDGVLKVSVPFKELPQPKKVTIGTGKPDKK
ncbi:MAG TPA: Hsp20/alpha crystallin family protein [Candidatus Saccharimonadales bacterium]|nr:Hsp20/alpha crystallin family protein [Candidatus Saccharimonadales bacterium]